MPSQHSPIPSSLPLGADCLYPSLTVSCGDVTCFSQRNMSQEFDPPAASSLALLTQEAVGPRNAWDLQDGGGPFWLNPGVITWRAIALQTHLDSPWMWVCIKPMRFGGCLSPQHDISHPG